MIQDIKGLAKIHKDRGWNIFSSMSAKILSVSSIVTRSVEITLAKILKQLIEDNFIK